MIHRTFYDFNTSEKLKSNEFLLDTKHRGFIMIHDTKNKSRWKKQQNNNGWILECNSSVYIFYYWTFMISIKCCEKSSQRHNKIVYGLANRNNHSVGFELNTNWRVNIPLTCLTNDTAMFCPGVETQNLSSHGCN